MARRPQTWQEKLANARAKHGGPTRHHCDKTGQWFVIGGIDEIEEMVRTVPAGEVLPADRMTAALAERHGVDFACPLTAGIFLWILANAAEEARGDGEPDGLPWWRVVKKGGELNPKYPGGGALQRERLEAEGRTVAPKGKRLVVERA